MNPTIKWSFHNDFHIMMAKFPRSEMSVNSKEWSTIHNLDSTKRIGIRLARLYELMENHDFMFIDKTTITIGPPQAEVIANTTIVLEHIGLPMKPGITWSSTQDYSMLILVFASDTWCSTIDTSIKSSRIIGNKLATLYGILLSNNFATKNDTIFTKFMREIDTTLTAVKMDIIL